jgi:acyl-CoA dehydrogenase
MRFDRDGMQREIADAAREFLAAAWSLELLRESAGGALPEDVWAQLTELGWLELVAPAEDGGLGLGPIEACAVFEESGRALLPGPLFDSVVAAPLCGRRGRAALALYDIDGEALLDGGRLTATKTLVESADAADVLLVTTPEAIAAVPRDAVEVRRLHSVDHAIRPFELRIDGVAAELVASGTEAEALLGRIVEWGLVTSSARALGVIDAIVDMSIEYAKRREQFGRPIGSFQAVQHRLADMAARAVTCRSVCYVAQWALATDAPDIEHKARVAKAYVSRAVREVAESGIQVHGGVGFTEEHDLHLLVKHALTLEGAWGDPGEHEDALADALSARAAEPAGSRV